MSAPQSAARQRNARPTPHWSRGNGHLNSLQTAGAAFPASVGCCPAPSGIAPPAIASLDLDVEDLALAHARDAGDAERFERAFDRLALGIEDAGFEGDGDAGLHRGSASIDMARIGQTASGADARSRAIARGDSCAAQSLGTNRFSAQGRLLIARGAARGPPRGRFRRRAAAPPRTPPACSRRPEYRAAVRAALPRPRCEARRRKSASPPPPAPPRKLWSRAR